MGKIDTLCELMYKWCCEMDMHYGQGNDSFPLPRYDFRYGGSTDCSGMVGHCMQEAGFDGATPTWWTGNMWERLVGKGWIRVEPDGNPKRGDILLNDIHHVGIWDGSHVIEFGGDPHMGYSTYHGYYDYPWTCYLRNTEEEDEEMKPCIIKWAGSDKLYMFNGNKAVYIDNPMQLDTFIAFWQQQYGYDVPTFEWEDEERFELFLELYNE